MAIKRAGQIVLTPFPYTDLTGAKLRPVLMLRKASRFDDWLVCMVSSQVHQTEAGLDEIISVADADFVGSGLKAQSVFRLSRLAVLDGALLLGSIGEISEKRLGNVRQRLANWIASD